MTKVQRLVFTVCAGLLLGSAIARIYGGIFGVLGDHLATLIR